MSLPRIGKEISAAEYWAQRSSIYKSNITGAYHSHRLDVIKSLLRDCHVNSKVCIDFGCGDGILLEYLARLGGTVIGFDISGEMAATARKRLSDAGLDGQVFAGSVNALRDVATESVDYLLAINVLHYFTDEEDDLYYRQAARVLRKGGTMIATHSNELFDLYTFNAFTVDFYEKHFCGSEKREDIASLLTYPKKPERVTVNIRENPLIYRYKLRDHGFNEVQQEFANLHPVPPLLMDPEVFIDIDKREYPNTLKWDEREQWKLMFMCSMFGSRSIKC